MHLLYNKSYNLASEIIKKDRDGNMFNIIKEEEKEDSF